MLDLTSGKLIGLPTETVYGLAGDATNPQAVAEIFARKGRPQFNPLIAHVPNLEAAQKHGIFNETALKLAQAFWPGPLTLVVPFNPNSPVCELARAGLETIAIRVPAHPMAQEVLQQLDFPLAAPSANKSGRLSPTTAQAVHEEFGDTLPILDGGACTVGLESTIVGCFDLPSTLLPPCGGAAECNEAEGGIAPKSENSPPSVTLRVTAPPQGGSREKVYLLRPGCITREQIEACTGQLLLSQTHADAPISPGQLLKHYAPNAPLLLNMTECTVEDAYLAFGAIPASIKAKTMLNLSEARNLTEAASNLFAHLRALDATHPKRICVAPLPRSGLGEAIYDRLSRGAD